MCIHVGGWVSFWGSPIYKVISEGGGVSITSRCNTRGVEYV